MCLAIPGQVKEVTGRQATVQYPGETRKVLVGEDGVKVGDFVMVQMGIVIKILTPKEAKLSLASWHKNSVPDQPIKFPISSPLRGSPR